MDTELLLLLAIAPFAGYFFGYYILGPIIYGGRRHND